MNSGRTYGGESADARQARQRRQFLDAGRALFGSVGYRATTVRSLCKQAGLTDRYFYNNFASTEDLLEAVYRDGMDQLRAAVLQAIAERGNGGTPRQIIDAALDGFFAAFEDARLARVCWLEVLGVSPRIDRLYTATIGDFAGLLLQLSRGVFPQWRIDDERGEVLNIALVGAISQAALHWLLSDYRASRATMVASTSMLFQGLAVLIEQPVSTPD